MATIVSETHVASYGSSTNLYARLEGVETGRTVNSVTVEYTVYFKFTGHQTWFNNKVGAILTVNGVAQNLLIVKDTTSSALYGNNGEKEYSVKTVVTSSVSTGTSISIPVTCVYDDYVGSSNSAGTALSPITISGNMPVSAYYVETNDASIGGSIYWQDENGNYISYPQSIYVTLYRNGVSTGLTDGGGSSWAFTGLPVYSDVSNGTRYVYTASFPEVDGYSKSVSSDGLNVTYRKVQVNTEYTYYCYAYDFPRYPLNLETSNGDYYGATGDGIPCTFTDYSSSLTITNVSNSGSSNIPNSMYTVKSSVSGTTITIVITYIGYTYNCYAYDFPRYPVLIELSNGDSYDISSSSYTFTDYSSSLTIYNVGYYGTGYLPESDYTVERRVSGTTINFIITYTTPNKSYVYKDGTWKEAQAYVYTEGNWFPVDPNILTI